MKKKEITARLGYFSWCVDDFCMWQPLMNEDR